MKHLKKLISLLLCCTLTAVTPLCASASASAGFIDTPSADAMISQPKEANFGTHIKWEYNEDKTAALNYNKAVYDVYVKHDTGKFGDNLDTVISQSAGIIQSVKCELVNSDGSYITPKIVDFEPKQIDHLNLIFDKNGDYVFYATSSTGVTAKTTIDVYEVYSPSFSSDSAPPELTITVPNGTGYVPGNPVTVRIESNQLCKLEIGDKKYSECTGVNFSVASDGVYTVKATNKNGKITTQSFTIDFMNGQSQPTTTTIRTTTTTTRPTTTTTTQTMTTTTRPTTTTTTQTTTTTTRPATTNTTQTTTTTTRPTTTTTTQTTTTTTRPTTTTTTQTTTITTRPTTTTTTRSTTATTAPPITTTAPTGYSIAQPDENELYAGNTIQLRYISPDGSKPIVYWVESSDYNKASCQNGVNVLLMGEGVVTLTAHCANNINISVTLNIKSKNPVTTQTTVTTVRTTTSPVTTATVTTKPTYTLGDVNEDGNIDSSDASSVLIEYARTSTGQSSALNESTRKAADVNNDNKIDSSDASKILEYYAALSTGKNPTWN